MIDILTTLHPENEEDINLYPNVKKDNIPNNSIDMTKLGGDVIELLNTINSLHPAGVNTSTVILAYTYNRGVWIGSDTGHWYYWNGSQYVDGGEFVANTSNLWIASSINLNDYTENGNYLLNNGVSYTNTPLPSFDVKVFTVRKYTRSSGNFIVQFIHGITSNKTYYRTFLTDWSDWYVFKGNYNAKTSGSIDCNTLFDNGKTLVFTGVTVSNKPSNVSIPLIIEVEDYYYDRTKAYIQQTIYNIDNGVKYVRHYMKGATTEQWTDWILLADNQVSSNVLYGKSIMAVGDSMVYGHSLGTSKTWLAKMCNRVGASANNKGMNGAPMSNYRVDSVYNRICNPNAVHYISDTADYVLIFAGTNDINNDVTLGNIDSTDPDEFYGALNLICETLQTRYPLSHIGFITPYNYNSSCADYINAIKNVCAKYGIKVFNNMVEGGVDYNNTTQHNALFMDDTHLNEDGHNWVSYKYQAFTESL